MIIFCLADVRSGTTAIARCFREAPSFVNLGEVFYEVDSHQGHYVKRWEHPASPSLDRLSEYLDFLRSDREHLYWLDIKFHDLGRFNSRQGAVNARPALLAKILQSGDPTVLIGRANSLRASVSAIQAASTGTFHVGNSDTQVTAQAEAPRDWRRTVAAIRLAVDRRTEFRTIAAHLRSHPRLFQVDYEALYDCPEAAWNRAVLGSWMGVNAIADPDLIKVSSDWPAWFDRELAVEILQGTSGEWWVS